MQADYHQPISSPVLSEVKLRLIRSGRESRLQAGTVMRTSARGWAALQAQGPREEADRVGVRMDASALQKCVDALVPVGAVVIVENLFDQGTELFPSSLGS